MADRSVKIDELRLRVPGLNTNEAYGLGEQVARRISDGLPAFKGSRSLGTLGLRVTVPEGTSRDRMATLIAEAISKGFV